MSNSKQHFLPFKAFSRHTILHAASLHAASLFLLGITAAASTAAPLNIANNALEVVIGVEPNIMIVSDDSGSMDWGTMTGEADGVAHLGPWAYFYTQPSPGASGQAPAPNAYFWVIPAAKFLADQGAAYPQGGVWRYWNSDYNKIYYNPDVTYVPWEGVNSLGATYTNASITNALYDPYNPGNGGLNLTATTTYQTDCGLAECQAVAALSGFFTVTNFYPAHYYAWNDSNGTTPANANNGVVDADDDHTLVEITPVNAPFTGRLAYDENTGQGRSDCTNLGNGTASCSYAEEIQNFANWFSYYRKRDLTAKAAFSAAVKPAETARIGYATINNNANNRIRVASMNVSPASGNKRSLLDSLFSTRPASGTPLRRALRNTGRYFDCASGDIFGSTSASSPGSANCPVLSSADGGQCQQNYAILMTDGFWNGGSPGLGNTDNGSGPFDGGAYADTHSNTLADVAMHYYETDLHSLNNEVPTTLRDIEGYLGSITPFETMHQHMATYTVGFGVNGLVSADPLDPSTAFVWPDPANGDAQKIDDLRHAAYNGRGQFLSANDPVSLTKSMKNIFSDISKSTGTATAVAFNTQEVEAGSLVFRASFNTKTNKGDLIAYAVTVDPVTKNIQVSNTPTWSAAEALDAKTATSSDSRAIISYKDIGTGSAGIPFHWNNLTSGTGSQQELLDSPQPANVPAAINTFGDERLNYLRGHSIDEGSNGANGEFRARSAIAGKLGDIVHSTPVFVGRPQFYGRNGGSYPQTTGNTYSEFVTAKQNRRELTYVGANDGMLHAFDTNDGSEVFAYVPGTMYTKLSNLTDPDYIHEYFVDLTVAVNDAFMTPTTGGTNNNSLSWNTILVGGLGAGGKGYYALNVTDPLALDTETEAVKNVLWEFTEADDGGIGNSDLGFTFSQPLISMSNIQDSSGNQKWVVIFGNGYNSTSTNGDAALYMLFIEGGQDGVWTVDSDFIKISTGVGKAESADGSTPNGIGGIRGVDYDGNGTLDYVYAGDLQGNLYRFDLTGTTLADCKKAPEIIFQARYDPLGSSVVQPITTSPIVVPHPTDSGLIVIAATGSWMTTDDATSTEIQSIYGIWDDMSTTPLVTVTSTNNQLVEQAFINQVNTEEGYTVRTLTNNAINWVNTGAATSKVKGWYIDLDIPPAGTTGAVEYPGERAVRNLQLRGGLLFVNTIIPRSTAACSAGAGGFELGFNPYTGGSGSKVIFDLNGDRTFSRLDNVNDTKGDPNIVTGIRFDTDTPTDSAFIGNQRMTQEGDSIRSFGTNTDGGLGEGRTSWREIIN